MDGKWVAINGHLDISPEGIEYVPTRLQTAEGQPEENWMAGVARSDMRFDRGAVELEVMLSDPRSACQLVLNSGAQPEINVGLNFGSVPYGMMRNRGGSWEPIAYTGFGSELGVGEWIPLAVAVQGSRIDLSVHGVTVCTAHETFIPASLGLWFHGSAETSVRHIRVDSERPTAFIVMQYSEQYNQLYEEVIARTCAECGFESIRADEQFTNGLIIDDIARAIWEASVVIADITPDNPNVFYELGFAHGIRRPTILMADRSRGSLPFDVSGFRTLYYDNTIAGKRQIEEKLRKHLRSIVA